MNGEAVKEIAERSSRPIELGGYIHRPAGWTTADPAALKAVLPKAPTFEVSTLGALRDYLVTNRDELAVGALIVHVETPYRVTVGSPLRADSRDRELFITAKAQDLALEFLNKYWSIEDMTIGLQTRFCDADQRAALLSMLANVKTEQSRGISDDGVSQTLEAKAVALRSEVPLLNPVQLTAFRTFRDIPQPSAPFVLRAKAAQGQLPTVMLCEADGGAWQLSTIAKIRDYLVEHLPTGTAVLA